MEAPSLNDTLAACDRLDSYLEIVRPYVLEVLKARGNMLPELETQLLNSYKYWQSRDIENCKHEVTTCRMMRWNPDNYFFGFYDAKGILRAQYRMLRYYVNDYFRGNTTFIKTIPKYFYKVNYINDLK